jgi:SAM-dependent methyltransferase
LKVALQPRACPVCASTDDSRIFAPADFDSEQWGAFAFASRKLPEYMHYRLIECPVCDLVYASPAPSEDLLAGAYREAAFDSSEESTLAARTYGGLMRAMLTSLTSRDGALDIGAGDGAFLNELVKAGFSNVVGVEPSTAPILAAQANVRSMLRQGLFSASQFQGEHFSLITCFQTLEHLVNPAGFSREVKSLLPGGGAVMFVCHNRRAFSARVLGLKSPIFDVEHMQLFSPRSLRHLLEDAGFVDVRVRPVINRYPLRYWSKLFPLPSSMKAALLDALKTSAVGAVQVPLPAGNLAAVAYRPPGESEGDFPGSSNEAEDGLG